MTVPLAHDVWRLVHDVLGLHQTFVVGHDRVVTAQPTEGTAKAMRRTACPPFSMVSAFSAVRPRPFATSPSV